MTIIDRNQCLGDYPPCGYLSDEYGRDEMISRACSLVSEMSCALFWNDYREPRDCFCPRPPPYDPNDFRHGGAAMAALELLVAGVCGVMGMAHAINQRSNSKTEEA